MRVMWDYLTNEPDLEPCGKCLVSRTCTDCGERVWCSKDEAYQVQVFCPICLERPVKRPAKADLPIVARAMRSEP